MWIWGLLVCCLSSQAWTRPASMLFHAVHTEQQNMTGHWCPKGFCPRQLKLSCSCLFHMLHFCIHVNSACSILPANDGIMSLQQHPKRQNCVSLPLHLLSLLRRLLKEKLRPVFSLPSDPSDLCFIIAAVLHHLSMSFAWLPCIFSGVYGTTALVGQYAAQLMATLKANMEVRA